MTQGHRQPAAQRGMVGGQLGDWPALSMQSSSLQQGQGSPAPETHIPEQ